MNISTDCEYILLTSNLTDFKSCLRLINKQKVAISELGHVSSWKKENNAGEELIDINDLTFFKSFRTMRNTTCDEIYIHNIGSIHMHPAVLKTKAFIREYGT